MKPVSNVIETVMLRWEHSFPGRSALGQELVQRYSAVVRVYHNINHLNDVLSSVDLMSAEADDTRAVELAAWFHDAVYDVRRDDNEERSAQLAETTLPAYDFDDDVIAEVARLVRLTQTHDPEPTDANGRVLCDADLAILASDENRYAAYVQSVRTEYRHVDDSSFATGRADVLRQLLALPSLFRTTYGRAHWEADARANLTSELEELKA